MTVVRHRRPAGRLVHGVERSLGARARAAWIPLVWIVLLFASNFRFSGFRDPALASSGVASPENAVELSLYAFVGLLAVSRWFGVRQTLRSPGLWGLGGFGVLAVASALWSRVPLFSLVRGAQVVVIAVLAVVSAAVWVQGRRRLREDWRFIWLGFVLTGLAITAVSLLAESFIRGRFTWLGQHPGTTGSLLGYAALVGLSAILEPRWALGRRVRSMMPFALIAAVGAMVLTIARTALLALVVSALVLYLTSSRTRFDLRVLAVSGVMLLVLGLLLMAGEPIFRFIARDAPIEQILTLTGRTELWVYALRVLRDAPLFGFGYGAGRLVLLEAIPWAGTGHNLWVEAGVSLGLTGVLVVTGLLVWMAYASARLQRLHPGPVGHLAGGLVAFEIVAAATGQAFALPGSGLTLAALVIAAVSAQRLLRVRNPDARTIEPSGGLS